MVRKQVSLLFSPWARMSRKLIDKIENPRFVGFFSPEEASMRCMRLAVGTFEDKHQRAFVRLFWLVDELDGVIADAKFQAMGPPPLLGIAEAACEFFMRKNYDQVSRITADLLEKQIRDKKEIESFPSKYNSCLNWVLEAAEIASLQCMDIPLSDSYVPTPMQSPFEGEARQYPNWESLTEKQQRAVIEEVIASDIRPYIELDAGGIEVVSLTHGKDLVIAYKGACTTCYSSVGSTLQAIQQILSTKVHPEIRVIPDSSFLQPP